MRNPDSWKHASHVLSVLGRMPRSIIRYHHVPNLQAFVLHCLCGPACFNFSRAAYLLNNKDFNQLQGITGFLQSEHESVKDDLGEIELFLPFLNNSAYHQHVSQFAHNSIQNNNPLSEASLRDIADRLGFETFTLCSWKTRFDNDGILLFEGTESLDDKTKEIFSDALCMIGLCPTY